MLVIFHNRLHTYTCTFVFVHMQTSTPLLPAHHDNHTVGTNAVNTRHRYDRVCKCAQRPPEDPTKRQQSNQVWSAREPNKPCGVMPDEQCVQHNRGMTLLANATTPCRHYYCHCCFVGGGWWVVGGCAGCCHRS